MIKPVDNLSITKTFESRAVNTFKLSDTPPVFVRGDGPWLYTQDDEPYLDLVCGSATSNLGHNHPAQINAIKNALDSGILHTGTRLISPFRAALYDQLSHYAGMQNISIHLSNSGSEAIETAIKLTRFITGNKRFIAFEGAYHGRTLGALSVTHSENIRLPFIGKIGDFVSFSPYPRDSSQVENCLEHCAMLFEHCKKAGEPIAGLLVEPIQGVSGVWGPFPEFLNGLRKLADSFGCLLIVDEIWSGVGRSGKKFSFQYSDIKPDLIVIGKGLSASLPLSAVIAKGDLLKQWKAGAHTSTFQGNPLACAAASATLQEIEESSLIDHVNNVIEPCFLRLAQSLNEDKNIGQIRFVGAQCAITLENGQTANHIQRLAMEKANILTYGGGLSGECVMLIPPLNISGELLSDTLSKLATIIKDRFH